MELAPLAAPALQPAFARQHGHTTDDPRWRYLFCDLLTDRPLCMMEMSGVKMTHRLSAVGELSGKIPIPNTTAADKAKLIIGQKTAVYALRSVDGSTYLPWWGGIVWSAPRASGTAGSAILTISASSFESFLNRGYLETDYADYVQTDQLAIARGYWAMRQSQPGGNIGMTGDGSLSGVLRDRSGLLRSNKLNLGDELDKLANVINGFEYHVHVYLDADGNRVKLLRLGYPVIQGSTVPLFSMGPGGGRLIKWGDTPDGTAGATMFYARGQAVTDTSNVAEEVPPPVSDPQPAQELLDAGWPRLVEMDDFSSVSDVATLNAHAQAKRDLYAGAVNTFTATVSVLGTSWTPADLGSVHRFRINDAWWQGQELQHRVIGCTITPPEKGSAESVDLVFETNADQDKKDADTGGSS